MERIRVQLLGGFAIAIDEAAVHLSNAAERVIAFVALQSTPQRREQVAFTLWPDHVDQRALANLRSVLWRVRTRIDSLLEADHAYLRLGSRVSVDYRAKLRECEDVRARETPDADLTALIHHDTELLPGWYEDWVIDEREWFRNRLLTTCEAQCRLLREHGDLAQAVDLAFDVVTAEPLRDTAYQELLESLIAAGNHADAMRHYERYRRRLNDEWGVRPSPAITGLIETIRS